MRRPHEALWNSILPQPGRLKVASDQWRDSGHHLPYVTVPAQTRMYDVLPTSISGLRRVRIDCTWICIASADPRYILVSLRSCTNRYPRCRARRLRTAATSRPRAAAPAHTDIASGMELPTTFWTQADRDHGLRGCKVHSVLRCAGWPLHVGVEQLVWSGRYFRRKRSPRSTRGEEFRARRRRASAVAACAC